MATDALAQPQPDEPQAQDLDEQALFGDPASAQPQPQPQPQPTRPSNPGKPSKPPNALMQLQPARHTGRITNPAGHNQFSKVHPAPPSPLLYPAAPVSSVPDDLQAQFAKFTDNQLAIVSMMVQGMSFPKIADVMHCTVANISVQCKKLGLDRYRHLTREQMKALSIVRWERLKLQAIDTATLTMDKAGPYQATMIAAVAQDKALALEAPAPSREIVDEVTLTLRRVSRGAGNTTCSVRGDENYLSEGETQKH